MPWPVLLPLLIFAASNADAMNYRNADPGVGFADVLRLPYAAPTAVEHYGPAPEQRGEFWLPGGSGPHPLIVFLHGGCWQNAFDLTHARPFGTALADAGYAVWSIEYRRIGDPEGGWPGTFDDVVRGIDHARALADDHPLDLSRLVLVGHSAGGHLALWAASSGKLTITPLHVVGLAAIADLERYATGASPCERAAVALMGGTPEAVPERYAAASPLRLPSTVPTTLVHGGADSIVNGSQARAMRKAHPEVETLRVRDAGHFDLIHPGTRAWRRFRDLLDEIIPVQRIAKQPQ